MYANSLFRNHIAIYMNATILFTFNIARNIYSSIVIINLVISNLVIRSLDNVFTTYFIGFGLTYFVTWFRYKNAVLFGWYTTIFDNNTISFSGFNRSLDNNTIICAAYTTGNIDTYVLWCDSTSLYSVWSTNITCDFYTVLHACYGTSLYTIQTTNITCD